MLYRTLLLDADNTLFDFTRAEYEALTDCLRARGLPHDTTVTDRYHAINDEYWKRLERGEITRGGLKLARFIDLFNAFGFDSDPATMAKDYMQALSTKAFLLDGAHDFCAALHGHCRLYLITNGATQSQRGRLARSPITPLFEDVFISEEMGCAKPEKAYFDAVAAAIPHFDPADALVIGDSLSSDMQGGINAGLATCWFNPQGKPAPNGMKINYIVGGYDEILSIVSGK